MNHAPLHQTVIVANSGALIASFGGHVGDIAAFLTITVNVIVLIRMLLGK